MRILLALSLLLLSGCATEYIEVRPQCTLPSQPALPQIDKGHLWDQLGDSEYRRIEKYINGLWAFADEQSAMLGELCATR